ncbi:MAG: hypothetical protein C4293_10835 [Nitrospiraceae bacterium]
MSGENSKNPASEKREGCGNSEVTGKIGQDGSFEAADGSDESDGQNSEKGDASAQGRTYRQRLSGAAKAACQVACHFVKSRIASHLMEEYLIIQFSQGKGECSC